MIGGLVIVVGVLIAVLARINVVKVNDQVTSKIPGVHSTTSDNFGATEIPAEPSLTKADLLRILDASISAVNKRIDTVASKQASQPVATLPLSTTALASSTTSYTGPKTIYIPVGYGGSGTFTSDFGTVAGQEVTIDTGNYPGYKQMVFEASFRIYQGNGTAFVRLLNKTDGTAVLKSDLSTTSQDYLTKTSSGFTLAGGSKTYDVQVKSTTGYSVDLQLTRIRVDF